MRHILTLLAALSVTAANVGAQPSVFTMEWTTAGNVRLAQTNYGICGQDVAKLQAGLIFPRTNGLQYLFGGGLWVGGRVRVADELAPRVLVTYEPLSGLSSAVPGELKNGRRPRPDLADEYAVQRSFRNGAEVLSCVYHFGDTTRYTTSPRSLLPGLSDIEVRERVYSFDAPLMSNTVIRTVELVNTGVDTVFGFVLGWVMDPDVGNPRGQTQPAFFDRNRVETVDARTYFYVARDADDQVTGEFGFSVLDAPSATDGLTIVGKSGFFMRTQHQERYEAMTSMSRLSDNESHDVMGLYATRGPSVFAPGDTLRYATVFVLMSPEERMQRSVSGPSAITQYYAEAATRSRNWLANQPTSVMDDGDASDAATVVPHPVYGTWMLYAPTPAVWDVDLYAADGRHVLHTTTEADGTLHGPSLGTGVYYISLRRGGEHIVRSVVVAR